MISVNDRIAGTVVFLIAVVASLAARSTAFMLITATLVVLFLIVREHTAIELKPPTAFGIIWAILAFALLSAAWTDFPVMTKLPVLLAMLLLACAQLLVSWVSLQSADRLEHLAFWLFAGFFLGAAFVLVEGLSKLGVQRWLMSTVSFFSPDPTNKNFYRLPDGEVQIRIAYLNRNAAVVMGFFWPALAAAAFALKGKARLVAMASAVAVAVLAIFASEHETSKLAILFSAAALALAWIRPRAALWLTAFLWASVVLLVLPLVVAAKSEFGLANASWLPWSAQHRILIWDEFAHRTLANPVIGAGARSAKSLHLEIAAPPSNGQRKSVLATTHPHNVYLQTWFELGAVGALLLLLAGFCVLIQIGQLSNVVLPFALATFVTAMVEIWSSWDVWQPWFFALLALMAPLMCIAAFIDVRRSQGGLVSTGTD